MMHKYLQLWADIYNDFLILTVIYNYVQLCTSIYSYVQVFNWLRGSTSISRNYLQLCCLV